jgi:serine/threonine-protein kinase
MMGAFIHEYMGNHEYARAGFASAAELLENRVTEIPSDPRYHSALGIAYAGLGRKEDAIREGLKAVDLLPVSKDAVYGVGHLQDLALIYTISGEYDQAIKKIEELLNTPSWITPVWLEWDIRFIPLKTHPEYKKLISKYVMSE